MYESKKYDFTSKIVCKVVERHLMKVGMADVVDFFRIHIDYGIYGNNLSSLYERITHVILSEGGVFNMKEVYIRGGYRNEKLC
jgi:hypothetical protein